MKELDKCIGFLERNGYIKMYSDDSEEEYQHMYMENDRVFAIELNEDEIVFIDDSGDYLHIPCNYYALVGACIHYSQIGIGYKH